MANLNAGIHKRRIYLIEKSFQVKFILKFCGLVVFGGLLTIGLLYLLAMQSNTVSFVNSRVVVRATSDFILPILIQTVAVVIVIVGLATVMVTLLFSHKIAGPLYRLKKVLKELEGGDFSGDFHIRHLDQLQDLAGTFNETINKTRERLESLQEGVNNLKVKLEGIPESDVSEGKRSAFSQLKDISEELDKAIRHFKT